METRDANVELKKEITKYYAQEIGVLKNIRKTIEDLDDQIDTCASELQKLQMSRIELENKFADKNSDSNGASLMDVRTSLELMDLENDYKKKIKKFRSCKNDIDKKISFTIQKLQKNGIIHQAAQQKKKPFKRYFDRWIFTIQKTYAEIYNV